MMGKDLLVVKIGGGEGLDLAATCDDLADYCGGGARWWSCMASALL